MWPHTADVFSRFLPKRAADSVPAEPGSADVSRTGPPRVEPPRNRDLYAAGYQPLVVITTAVATGIVVNDATRDLIQTEWARPGLFVWLMIAAGCLWNWRRAERDERPRVATAWLLVAVAATSGAWHHVYLDRFSTDHLARQLGPTPQPVCVTATVTSEPRTTNATAQAQGGGFPPRVETELHVEIQSRRTRDRWRDASGAARLQVVGTLTDIHAGDRIRLLAVASRPSPAGNPGEFDVARAERGQRRLLRLHAKSTDAVSLVARPLAWNGRRALAELRAAGQRCLTRHVGGESATLASALLLGTRNELDAERNELFFVTGLAHLLAISGLNVAMFAYGFWAIVRLGWLPRRVALAIVAALAVFYALLTGADPPVVRAAILVVCVCVARFLGRQGLAYNTLAVAALLILLANPEALFQTDAQLSFLAVAVLCRSSNQRVVSERRDALDKLLARERPWWRRGLRRVGDWSIDAVMTSGRVWVVSLPLVVWRFHLISPIALLLNPIVLAPTAVALYAGFLTLVLANGSPRLADGAGALCRMSLELLGTSMEWGRALPGNHGWWAGPSGVWVAAFYFGAAAVPLAGWSRRICWTLAIVAVVLLLGPVAWWCERAPGGSGPHSKETWHCTFVAVGHGTSVLVESPDGRAVLYDCGRLGAPTRAARSIAALLWSRGRTHLDAVVISHADSDHFNALPDLLERFSIGRVYVSRRMAGRRDRAWAEVCDALAREGTPLCLLEAGDSLPEWQPGVGRILHPPPSELVELGSDNAESIVLSIDVGGRRILLPGDLEGAGLRAFVARIPEPHDIVMAPHHGSERSQPETLWKWAQPTIVVVSGAAGKAPETGPPGREADRPIRWFHTARDGAIHLQITSDSVRIWSWQGRWRKRAELVSHLPEKANGDRFHLHATSPPTN